MMMLELQEYRSDLLAAGLCIECKQCNATEGARCGYCAVLNTSRTLAWQAKRRESGQCVRCGEPAIGELCTACKSKRRTVHHESRRTVQCGRPSAEPKFTDDPSKVTCRFCVRSMEQ